MQKIKKEKKQIKIKPHEYVYSESGKVVFVDRFINNKKIVIEDWKKYVDKSFYFSDGRDKYHAIFIIEESENEILFYYNGWTSKENSLRQLAGNELFLDFMDLRNYIIRTEYGECVFEEGTDYIVINEGLFLDQMKINIRLAYNSKKEEDERAKRKPITKKFENIDYIVDWREFMDWSIALNWNGMSFFAVFEFYEDTDGLLAAKFVSAQHSKLTSHILEKNQIYIEFMNMDDYLSWGDDGKPMKDLEGNILVDVGYFYEDLRDKLFEEWRA